MSDNLNLIDAEREWVALGGTVRQMRRKGEKMFRHPSVEIGIVVNMRRKDVGRKLMVHIRRLRAAEAAP